MAKRILVSSLIGLLAGVACWFLHVRLHQNAGDFRWAIHLAERLVARQNPYDTPFEQYPLPAALAALPLLRVPPEVAAGLFYGVSTFLLALGLSRHSYCGLLAFLSYPYWAGLLVAQWSAIITAAAFFPFLMPATMMKPQVGLPVLLTRLSRRGILACLLVGALSMAVLPNWPRLWLGQTRYYEHFIPLLVFPGALILLALARHRDRDAWLLLLSAMMPQRWFFDSLILWLIPKSRRQIVLTAGLSWIAGVWRWYHPPHSFTQVGRWVVIFNYLPMLAIVLWRKQNPEELR